MGIQKYKTARGETRYGVNTFNKFTGKTQWVGTFKTAEDAKIALSEAERAIRLGELAPKRKDIGFSDLVDEWLSLQTVNLRESTKKDYAFTSRYLRDYFKNRPVSTIERADVYRFVASVSKKDLSAHYIRKMNVRLSQIFKFAEAMGYTTQKPTAEKVTNLPEEPEKRVRPLTAAQVRALIESTPAFWRPLMLVLVTCGLRRSEAFGLTRDNVDLKQGLLRVTHQLVGGRLVPPKTKRAKRTIPLPKETLEALRSHLNSAPASDLDLVFVTEAGAPVDYMNFRKRVWIPTVKKAGLRGDLTLHDLRRTFASAMARQGRSAGYLQDVMGHQQPSTTMTYYIGVYDEERAAAIKDMEDWLTQEEQARYGAAIPCRLTLAS